MNWIWGNEVSYHLLHCINTLNNRWIMFGNSGIHNPELRSKLYGTLLEY
uniref:Uncharacterized protein n=1 Tax=Arundo donax TaxID=35708 RepID=A0A0A9HWC7_ARUDO